MTTFVAERLRRKAAEYGALGEEHTAPDDPLRLAYEVVEIALREVADAVEDEGRAWSPEDAPATRETGH